MVNLFIGGNFCFENSAYLDTNEEIKNCSVEAMSIG